jgi:ubiquinone/menaquinone biosynthesis C-methylase UbiE
MDLATQQKWDRAARTFNIMAGQGAERRWQPFKKALFAHMKGNVLFMALGTGFDIATFPPDRKITAIDISPRMLELAKPRIEQYDGTIEAHVMDVHEMSFADGSFDQVFTSCTFCSVPDPVEGLRAVRRVLKPGGDLYMFEHTGSQFYPFRFMMDLMNPLARKLGPNMNRNTVANVAAAGFRLIEVNNVFLDVVKTIHAVKP